MDTLTTESTLDWLYAEIETGVALDGGGPARLGSPRPQESAPHRFARFAPAAITATVVVLMIALSIVASGQTGAPVKPQPGESPITLVDVQNLRP